MMPANRRDFLKNAIVGTTVVGVGGMALSSFGAEKTSLTPSLIIDTHTHFYDPSRPQGVPWPQKGDAVLYRTILPKTYKALPKPQPVNGTVVVEASKWVEDNQWILDLAKDDPFIVGFVGNLPVGTAEFRGHLEKFAANPIFRGVRIGSDLVQKAVAQPEILRDLRLVAERDLQIDVLVGPAALPRVAELAAAISSLRIVIDHVANVKIDGQAADTEWLRGLQAASKQANVYCKVSGLVEGSGRKDGTAPREVDFYRPILDAVWECFGENRVIYGSNWPVSERFAACATVQAIVTEYFQSKGTHAVEKYFWKNAQAVYKWVKR